MIRLAVRQLRWAIVSTGILLLGLAVALTVSRYEMTSYLTDTGLGDCLARHGDCSGAVDAFVERFGLTLSILGALNLTPVLIGVFWGAPLVAREVEQGTHRLVWTQSVSRARWFWVKMAVLLAAAVAVSGAVTGLFTWWAQPFLGVNAEGYSRINPAFYSLEGVLPVMTAVCAFAVGVAASVLIRRTVPAMAAGLAATVAAGLVLVSSRAELLRPYVLRVPFGANNPRAGLGDWVLHPIGIVDRNGGPATVDVIQAACPTGDDRGIKIKSVAVDCLAAHGFQHEYVYQPLSRFWPLQGIESGILLGATVGLLALAAWWITRRVN